VHHETPERVIPESLRKPTDEEAAPDETPAAAEQLAPTAEAPAPTGDSDTTPESADERIAPKEAAEPIAPAALPKEQLESIVESVGLQWVETTHRAEPAAQPEEVPAPRPRRVRKPRNAASGEPLEQVETVRPNGAEH